MDESLTDSTYLILLTLLEPKHGYLIMKQITAFTNGEIEIGPASMYTILKKLLKDELIELTDSTSRKKIYQITMLGKEVLKKDIVRRKIFFEIGEAALRKDGETNW